ncbi:ribosomal protein L29 [Desulfohalotomaculum tongense]|nr:ribosomal protein L29 [Desulforadius tongensis]
MYKENEQKYSERRISAMDYSELKRDIKVLEKRLADLRVSL